MYLLWKHVLHRVVMCHERCVVWNDEIFHEGVIFSGTTLCIKFKRPNATESNSHGVKNIHEVCENIVKNRDDFQWCAVQTRENFSCAVTRLRSCIEMPPNNGINFDEDRLDKFKSCNCRR